MARRRDEHGHFMAKDDPRPGRPVDGFIAGQRRGPKRGGWTGPKRARFLDLFGSTLNIALSARMAGVARESVYELKKRDPSFRTDMERVLLERYAQLEGATLTRLIDGAPKGVWHGGARVGEERVFNDAVAARLLAQHRQAVAKLRAEASGRSEGELLAELERDLAAARGA